uniref:NADH-ubiquinone oxidoreductase chain 3 n=1 Tax=Euplotes vanleeuwenhoeki TaxID=2794224 RepID=A0A7T1C508_9SPIT|nr:NAD(P)H-quinone oxidoreductase subunit 3 [Euplotes vanleeuwenhoeki]QPM99270.1 NAD(P)H-quinone oxidoreductase subunit 3 [Euplotes vanleeuwenhoeki]
MGTFEILHFWALTLLLVTIVVVILSIFSSKNLLNRFGFYRPLRREFYECGFRPVNQKPIQFSLQFLMIIVFFLIYDIELIFSFPLISHFMEFSFLEFIGIFLLYGLFLISLLFDYDQNILNWKF